MKPNHVNQNWRDYLELDANPKGRLKPCPFCRAPAFSQYVENDLPFGEVKCGSCDATIERRTEAEAITAWNARA